MSNKIWEQTLADLAGAECMFNNAVSPFHTDLAIRAINNAIAKLELLKDVETLNKSSEYSQMQSTIKRKKTMLDNIKKLVKWED